MSATKAATMIVPGPRARSPRMLDNPNLRAQSGGGLAAEEWKGYSLSKPSVSLRHPFRPAYII